jgi:branched-chain amino acid transport system substrate-binding protein
MKKAVIILAFIVVCALALLVYFEGSQPDTIRIGYIGTISGKFSALGTSARNGAVLAVEEINQNSKPERKKIELVIKDDEGIPENSTVLCNDFHSEGINIIVGPFTTASATAILPCINEKNILTVGPVTAGENLSKLDDMFIKLFPSTSDFGKATGELAIQKGIKKIAIINDLRNEPFGETFLSGFLPLYDSHGKVVARTNFKSGSKLRYSELVHDAANSSPEGALIIASAIDTALISQHLKKKLPKLTIFVSPWSMSKELIASGGKAVEGTYSYIPFDLLNTSSSYKRFEKAYSDRFGESPPFVAAFNYEAIQMIWTGLNHNSQSNALSLKNTLLKIKSFRGLQSEYKLSEAGDAERPLFLYQIRDRKITKIN